MAIDYKLLAINGTDADQTSAFASTAATAAAKATQAVSGLSAELAAFLATPGMAVMYESATAAQKKAVAFTLLLSAGMTWNDIATAAQAANPNTRGIVRARRSVDDGESLIDAIFA